MATSLPLLLLLALALAAEPARAHNPSTEQELAEHYVRLHQEQPEEPASTRPTGWFSCLFRRRNRPETNLRAEFQRIEQQLVATVASSEAQPNLEAVVQWLSIEPPAEPKMRSALSTFAQLATIDESNRCGAHSDSILRLNENLIEAGAPGGRLEEVVRNLMLEHAAACDGVYQAKYAQLLTQLPDEAHQSLLSLLSDQFLAQLISKDPKLVLDLALSGSVRPGQSIERTKQTVAAELVAALKQQVFGKKSDDLVIKGKVNKKRFLVAYEQLLAKPCRQYVQQLGPEVFSPLSLDLSVSDQLFEGQLDGASLQLVLGLGRYEFCKLIQNDAQFAAQVTTV